MRPVNIVSTLFAAGALHPPRAASLRRFVAFATQGLATPISPDALAERARRWSALTPLDEPSAARRLVGEDLAALEPRLRSVERRIEAWSRPEQAVEQAVGDLAKELSRAGLELSHPSIRLVERMPPPYDHPLLDVVSLDASDAAHLGGEPGLLVRTRRLQPFAAELALGHVLVHHALGQRSPERLGRGLEEGVCEVLGALGAAAAAIGQDAVLGCFLALRRSGSLRQEREVLLDAARAAARLRRCLGEHGLGALAARGRAAIKQVEAELLLGRLGAGPASEDWIDEALSRPRPLVVGPLAFVLAGRLGQERSVRVAAGQLGAPFEAALEAARELHERAFVVVLDAGGQVLAEDLDLVMGAGGLRYGLPLAPA